MCLVLKHICLDKNLCSSFSLPGCVRPFSIQHGQVNVTETNRGSFPVGTVLQYSCDSGYTVDGPSIVMCTRESLWSSGPPRCLHNSCEFLHTILNSVRVLKNTHKPMSIKKWFNNILINYVFNCELDLETFQMKINVNCCV